MLHMYDNQIFVIHMCEHDYRAYFRQYQAHRMTFLNLYEVLANL